MKKKKVNWIVTDEFSKRVPGLFIPEFIGDRMICLSSKFHIVCGKGKEKPKIYCKGTNKRQNQMTLERYLDALNGKTLFCKRYWVQKRKQ